MLRGLVDEGGGCMPIMVWPGEEVGPMFMGGLNTPPMFMPRLCELACGAYGLGWGCW